MKMAKTSTKLSNAIAAKSSNNGKSPAPVKKPLLSVVGNIAVLGPDDAASTKVERLTPNKVRAIFTVKPSADSEDRFAITSEFDFSKCTPEDIQGLALRSLVIDAQRNFRTLHSSDKAKALLSDTWQKIDVKAELDKPRNRMNADPVGKAKRALDKLDPAVRAALMKELMK